MGYTPEQIRIARYYESKAFSSIHDQAKFDEIMREFDEIKKGWENG